MPIAAAGTILAALLSLAALGGRAGASSPEEVVIRGRTVCLDGSGNPAPSIEPCASGAADHRFALRTGEGELVRFSARDPRAEILGDPRVHEKELEVSGWLSVEGELQIVKLYTFHDGRWHQPYYFCATCNITAQAPGPCWCCRQPFEFRERPVEEERR